MPTILGKKIEWHQRYTLEIPKPDEIDQVGRGEVAALVYRLWRQDLPGDWNWQWVLARGQYCGTLPKRVSSWLFRQHAVKAQPKELEELGNLAAKYVVRTTQLTFDFDNQLDWKAGDFGDDGSCYWGCYSGARVMLRDHLAFAVRFYREDGKGYARAWIIPMHNSKYLLMYNVYGMDGNAVQVQRVLSQFFNTSYSSGSVPFTNRGDSSSTLYINGGKGWLIGPTSEIEPVHEVNLDWQIEDGEEEYRCEHCDEQLDEDETYSAPDGSIYCQGCWDERCFNCACCEREGWRSDAYTDDNGATYCPDCYNDRYISCDRCDAEIYRDDNGYEIVEGDAWCDRCVQRHAAQCERCEEYFQETTSVDGREYCQGCLERYTVECEVCHDRVVTDQLDQHMEEEHDAETAIT